jgi:hypothetical protein
MRQHLSPETRDGHRVYGVVIMRARSHLALFGGTAMKRTAALTLWLSLAGGALAETRATLRRPSGWISPSSSATAVKDRGPGRWDRSLLAHSFADTPF